MNKLKPLLSKLGNFFQKLLKGVLAILDLFFTFILSFLMGTLLFSQITLLSPFIFIFSGVNGLINFYKDLGRGKLSFIIFKNKFN
jgi:hypothetical protein